MRARALLRLPAAALAAVLLAGCHGAAGDPAPAASSSADPSPTLGGPHVVRSTPPAHPMNTMERPIAAQLARQLARQGLRLGYLDCPPWDGTVPSAVTCRGYVDGLVTAVRVVFTREVEGKAVGFDASLTRGVIATRTLVDTLRRQGWQRPDCGDVPAYPARVGSRIVCRVVRGSRVHYLVATVRGRAGAVSIEEYHPASGS